MYELIRVVVTPATMLKPVVNGAVISVVVNAKAICPRNASAAWSPWSCWTRWIHGANSAKVSLPVLAAHWPIVSDQALIWSGVAFGPGGGGIGPIRSSP